jgi:hypothetical protein
MNKIYLNPSVYAHIINGLLLFLAFMLIYKKYSKIIQLEPYKVISLTLLLSLSIGIHGLSHLGLEKAYNYNPLSNVL